MFINAAGPSLPGDARVWYLWVSRAVLFTFPLFLLLPLVSFDDLSSEGWTACCAPVNAVRGETLKLDPLFQVIYFSKLAPVFHVPTGFIPRRESRFLLSD